MGVGDDEVDATRRLADEDVECAGAPERAALLQDAAGRIAIVVEPAKVVLLVGQVVTVDVATTMRGVGAVVVVVVVAERLLLELVDVTELARVVAEDEGTDDEGERV